MKQKTEDARGIALTVLNRLTPHADTLDAVMDDVRSGYTHWDRREKSFLNALVYGVLRNRGRLDWVIAHFSKSGLKKIDPGVLNILRIGLYQMFFLDRIPVSAAVNTSVEMTKRMAAPWVVRFVNGLLRNASRNYDRVPFPDMDKNPVSALAVAESFPAWLISRWIDRFGVSETRTMCQFLNTIPPVTIRTNTLKTSRTTLLKAVSEEAETAEVTAYASEGITITGPKTPVFNMPSFRNGGFQVQDEAAQLVSRLLSPRPGESILDACAGLGGKTGHIAQLMENCGSVLAVDKDKNRLASLAHEMKRLGVSIVTDRRTDLCLPLDQTVFSGFDKIFIDAPCSGLGVIRRNPDIKWRMQPEQLPRLAAGQIQLLNNLAPRVNPGGVIVYTVCSLEPEETVDVIDAFLKTNPGFSVDSTWDSFLPLAADFKDSDFKDSGGFFRTRPHIHRMDGFFSARLIKFLP
jgi:16S rRNA (cytosine967-C5)-methyltransferase